MPETTPLIKAALNLRVGAGFDVYAEKETRRREDERRHELLSENPLDINYARWATEEEIKQSLTPLFVGNRKS